MRKLVSLLAIGLSILALYALQKSIPTYGDIISPIAIAGTAGEKLTARNFELTVTQARFAKKITLVAFGNERSYGTSGVWAIVEAEAAARDKTVTVASVAWLGANGTRYLASDRLSTAPALLTERPLEPGLPRRVLMILELPESEMSKGTLVVAHRPFQPLDSEMHIAMEPVAGALIHDQVSLIRGRSVNDWSLRAP